MYRALLSLFLMGQVNEVYTSHDRRHLVFVTAGSIARCGAAAGSVRIDLATSHGGRECEEDTPGAFATV